MIPKKHKVLLQTIGAYADKLGLKAWIVGGAVRDFYLGKDTQDLDLTFEGSPEAVAGFCVKKWGGEKKRFSQFNTYRVKLTGGLKLDLVQARKEFYPRPGALPQVTPSDIKDDLFRRDFTANAWALSILPKNFGCSYDPFGAQEAIDKGVIKVLHSKSFCDDPTRLYRAVRFAGRFGWNMERGTKQLMRDAVREEYPLVLSRERIRQEFVKLLEEKKLRAVFSFMEKYDLAQFIYPGLKWNAAISKGEDSSVKLGICACLLADSGAEFLQHLHLPRETVHELMGAWTVYEQKQSPLSCLTPLQISVLRAVCPSLKPTALEPCFVKGGELREIGLSGRKISSNMERLCKLQWQGRITNKEQAMKHLEK